MNNPYLKSLEPIWEAPKFVFVDGERLKEAAKDFAREELKTPNWRELVLPKKDDKVFVDFLGLNSAVNFCFTDPWTKKKFQTEYKGKLLSGTFAMSACLMRVLEEGIPILDYGWLKSASLDDMQSIFRGLTPMPLLPERLEIFHEVGEVLERKYGGHFYNLFEKARYRAFTAERSGIVDRLIRDFPSFWDVSWHEPSRDFLQFHKRAQLYVLMYQGRALDSKGKLSLIVDAENLGPPADYRIPQALKKLGILRYESSLEKRIMAQKIIQKDSLEEQEIRAQMTYAMVKLCELLNTWIGPVDYKVWSAGAKMKKGVHHLTPTTAY
ncbi:MAG: hypothetical protein COV69_02950 [Parcubacteria group bacterium CG11_big_fil_rev_8_21_14_0_20_39_14]|nr:MAG: hypothetical protein COV69_02950 [Parcubacteria group bacterium CG11_big_fil_rev_8_21_14_0_20_39_14]PIS35617.1 MAG: hypothetical protein COT36_01560 [Parcubacteria group bacterium CG08_land_8_20_14_0_20_38_56]